MCTATSPEAGVTNQQGKQKKEKKQKGPANGNNNNNNRRRRAAKGADEPTSSLEEIRAGRIQKASDLRTAGMNPYAYRFDRTASSAELASKYESLGAGEEVQLEGGDMEAVSGRVIARRAFGKLAFYSIQDESGTTQLYCDKAKLNQSDPEAFSRLSTLVDIGDIIGARGSMKRTEKGELSVNIAEFEVLTKSILPLPDKFHGLQDVEKRYRQRYVDLIVNPEVRNTFRDRARIVSLIRRTLEDDGFLEMETPVLETVAGGADARPFKTHHNALDRPMILRIATELHLKRLIVGGFEKVFELGRVFRNEGISTRHNPEFTSVEVYQAYADINEMMDLTEKIVANCAQQVCGKLKVDYQGTEIDFSPPFRRAPMNELVREATGVDFLALGDLEAAREAAAAALKEAGVSAHNIPKCPSVGHVLNEVFEEVCESTLQQPTFVLQHPIEISPLAKPHPTVAGVADRFELFIYGRELANAFSELTDPLDQRQRLEAQVANHVATGGGKESKGDAGYDVKVDEDFLTALEYGMPPCGGLGIGVDRLVMLLTDAASIRDVIAFPVLKSAE